MQKFYRCPVCGKIIAIVEERNVPTICCGKPMEELTANTVEASFEKHIPEFEVKDGIVKVVVGSVEHPMLENHYIGWISLQTNKGNQRKVLKPGDAPKAEFALLDGEEVEAVYAWCNLHGLWKK